VRHVAFTNGMLASASARDMRTWDPRTGREIACWRVDGVGIEAMITTDDQVIVGTDGGDVWFLQPSPT
jgi:hypothetical protein